MKKITTLVLTVALAFSSTSLVGANPVSQNSTISQFNEPQSMKKPPVIKLRARNAVSQIKNNVQISSIGKSGKLNNVFLYSGDMKQAGTSFPDKNYVKNTAVTSTNSMGSFTVEFVFKGTQLELMEKGTGGKYRISVDEGSGYSYVNSTALNAAPADGGTYLRLVKFGSNIQRTIKIEYDNTLFGGVIIGPKDKVTKPAAKAQKTIMFFGDSYTEGGSSGAGSIHGYAPYTASLLGLQGWYSGVGGTGYIATGPVGRVNFQARVKHDVISYKPDILVIAGGINDEAYSVEDVKNAASLLYKEIKVGSPKTQIIVLSGWNSSGTPSAQRLAIKESLFEAALENGLPFIDVVEGKTYLSDGTLITDSGLWINIQNVSTMISGDKTHPTIEGHKYLGEMLAAEISKVINK